MLPLELDSILVLLTWIKRYLVLKNKFRSFLEWPFYTCFTVAVLFCSALIEHLPFQTVTRYITLVWTTPRLVLQHALAHSFDIKFHLGASNRGKNARNSMVEGII